VLPAPSQSPGPATGPAPTPTQPPPPPTAPAPASTSAAAPAAGPGLVGQLLYRLGFVPASQFAPLTAEAASLQTELQGLQGQYASAQTALAALQAQERSLQSEVAQLQAQLASLGGTVSSLTSQAQGLESAVAQDASTIASLKSSLASALGNLGGLTTIAASPSSSFLGNGLVSSDQPWDSQTDGLTYFVDPGTTGFPVSFAHGYTGLVGGSATQLSGSWAPGGMLASALGYVPIRQATDADAQIASLESQVSSAQAALSGVESRIGAANTAVGSLKTEVAQLESGVTGDQSAIATLQSRIQALTQQHQTNLGLISTLQSEVQSVTSLVSQLTGGDLSLVDFSWDFGAGTGSGTPSPSYTYGQAGTFQPSLTITVNVPATPLTAARTITRTFTLGQFLLGRWPTEMPGHGGGASYSGTAVWTLTDTAGDPVTGCRVNIRATDAVGVQVFEGVGTTDSTGSVYYNYSGPQTIRARCLRNPTLTGQQGGGTS
jgi:peptidoglycan hydrolase CwlO-like protein